MSKIHPDRKFNRLPEYDYSSPAYYFVTTCVNDKQCYFGEVLEEKMVLNNFGRIVKFEWERLFIKYSLIRTDYFVVMPNHFHGILIIDDIDDIVKEIIKNSTTTINNKTGVGIAFKKDAAFVGTTHELSLQQKEKIELLKRQSKKSLSTYIGEFKMLSSKKSVNQD
jgi:REP element-mobilizing transposase RayT